MRVKWVSALALMGLLIALSWPSYGLGAPATVPPVPHTLEGRQACTNCHQTGTEGVGKPGGLGMPVNHTGRPASICLGCHATASEQTPASAATTEAPKPSTPAISSAQPPVPTVTVAASGQASLPNSGELEEKGPLGLAILLGGLGLVALGLALRKAVAGHR